ncbi:serine protease [Candidatus Parcubacteria bacterium]|nr:serine protease [Candidatus Parcubacteria bacterium]
MQQKNKKNGIVLVIVLAVIFGMASGVVGELIARSYLLNYNIPFFGEISFTSGDYGGANLIIRDAKKVIVEQDTKVIETINSVNNSLVGIFKKQKINKDTKKFNLDDYYRIDQEAGQGLVVSSDGWIITNFLPAQTGLPAQAGKLGVLANYVVITKDKKIYTIDNIVSDSLTPFYFIHIKVSDLPVRKFASINEINNGQLMLAVNWDGYSWLSRISNKQNKGQNIVNFSDVFLSKFSLMENIPEEFKKSVLFSLAGDVVGLIDDQGGIEPIYHFSSAIKSLFKYKEIRRASIGVNYINLSDLVKVNAEDLLQNGEDKGAMIYKNNKGIAVVKGSAADLAGLAEGDIIILIGNIEINKDNNLSEVIQSYLAGDKVKIVYLHNGKREEVEVVLGEVEK